MHKPCYRVVLFGMLAWLAAGCSQAIHPDHDAKSLWHKPKCIIQKQDDEKAYRTDTSTKAQVGNASYYAKCFQGRRTASGEKCDLNGYTAAHRTFPFGTKVRVTMLQNGKSVIVRINDRGPFSKGRIIDLSFAAARQIGLVRAGVAKVKIEKLQMH
jgi:rare lipoprotein A